MTAEIYIINSRCHEQRGIFSRIIGWFDHLQTICRKACKLYSLTAGTNFKIKRNVIIFATMSNVFN